jgi:hypothetical protein
MEYQSTPFESALGMFFVIMLGVGLFISFISVINVGAFPKSR